MELDRDSVAIAMKEKKKCKAFIHQYYPDLEYKLKLLTISEVFNKSAKYSVPDHSDTPSNKKG